MQVFLILRWPFSHMHISVDLLMHGKVVFNWGGKFISIMVYCHVWMNNILSFIDKQDLLVLVLTSYQKNEQCIIIVIIYGVEWSCHTLPIKWRFLESGGIWLQGGGKCQQRHCSSPHQNICYTTKKNKGSIMKQMKTFPPWKENFRNVDAGPW